MSYELLSRAVNTSLPLPVDEDDDMDTLRLYVAAGLVEADFTPPAVQAAAQSAHPPRAFLTKITAVGRRVLASVRGERGTRFQYPGRLAHYATA
jgi:hypothetical protein